VHTHDDILYPKCLPCIYVLVEDGSRRPKYVGGITYYDKTNFYARMFKISRNKYTVINILYGTGTALILMCELCGGMCQDGVMA